MTSKGDVLLVARDDATADLVRSAVGKYPDASLAAILRSVSDLRVHLDSAAAGVVLVDIDADPAGILGELELVVSSHPGTRVVVISSVFSNDLVLEAMQAGARRFLLKESFASELGGVLKRLVGGGADAALGCMISVFSAGGGCGATTVAINLANELRLLASEPVLAIDMDDFYGTMSAYLGISGHYGIADVMAHKGPIDKNLIRSSSCNYTEDFHVLAASAGMPRLYAGEPDYENLSDVLHACRQAYKYTVIDAPRVRQTVAAELAAASKLVIIVMQLTVKDIKIAQAMIEFLTARGVTPKKIVPLANRCRNRGPLVRPEDGRKALGVDVIRKIRSDFSRAAACLNRGLTLAQSAPRSGLRRDFQRLAAAIHAYERNGDDKVLGA